MNPDADSVMLRIDSSSVVKVPENMSKVNAFYAQSGGVTAVINASAAGVIEAARHHPDKIGNVYAGGNGIIGALTEDLIDTSADSAESIAALRHTRPVPVPPACDNRFSAAYLHLPHRPSDWKSPARR